MQRILFVIPDLRIGGAEKTLLEIINKCKDDFIIDLLCIQKKGDLVPFFEKECHQIFELTKSKFKFVAYNRKYKTLLSKSKINQKVNKILNIDSYDHVISFLEGSATHIVKNLDFNKTKTTWVHIDLKNHNIKDITDTYSSFDNVVSVSLSCYQELAKYNINSQVIPNLINVENIKKLGQEKLNFEFNNDNKVIVSVGRLAKQKAHMRLIQVSNEVFNQGYEHNLVIVGKGREYKKLKKQTQGHIKIINGTLNPYKYIANSDLFVLFSNYEGYGIVVDEALILNKPVAITNTYATNALKNHGVVIENNKDAIFNFLVKYINNEIDFNFEKKDIEKIQQELVINIKELLNV